MIHWFGAALTFLKGLLSSRRVIPDGPKSSGTSLPTSQSSLATAPSPTTPVLICQSSATKSENSKRALKMPKKALKPDSTVGREIKRIVIHCSATDVGEVESIRRYHVN